jgi:glycosyltransferase involved in cell wall biosynthesis
MTRSAQQVWAALVALLLIFVWQGPPRIPALFSELATPQFIRPLTFMIAAILAAMLPGARLSSGMNITGRIVHLTAWIVSTHVLWMLILFASGMADLPRWLPIATAAVMGFFVVVPLAFASLRDGRLIDGLYGAPGNKAELIRSAAGERRARRRAWVISYTGVANEPRVLRQCEALLADGWDLVVCGYEGHSSRPVDWNFIRLPTTESLNSYTHKLFYGLQTLGRILLIYGRPAALFQWAARVVHGTTPLWFHTKRELVALARAHPELKADLVISHDYHAADVGFAVAQAYGAKFSIDVHEYAAGQYFNDPHWVKWERPVAIGVQRYYLARADVVTVVCQGIADLLAKDNHLQREPITIRSVPFKSVQPFRPVGSRIEVLYHGDLSVRREIHALIESMRHWRENIDLRLRGSGDPAYIADLKRQIVRLNLEKRVRFEPPVPFSEIIPAANRSDIGFFSFKGDSPQIRFTLPNKFFEYIMAGLCLCVGDTSEVGHVVRQYGCGKLIPSHSPEAIAEAVNSLSAQQIEAYKRASIAAAEELNWEVERGRLLQAYDAALQMGPTSATLALDPVGTVGSETSLVPKTWKAVQ